MRSKEDAHDYRYFPDPDLLPLILTQEKVDKINQTLPELPQQKKNRYVAQFSINPDSAEIITDDLATALFFEEVLSRGANPIKAVNWLNGQVSAYLNENNLTLDQTKLTPELLAEMISLIEDGTISDNIAKNDIIIDLITLGVSARTQVQNKGLAQITDTSAIEDIVKEVLDSNPNQVAQFKSGNDKIKGFFVGQIMKKTQGKASPQIINQCLDKLLSA
jgi:aspartyl-tRNA(Asn)/glutamyl-tRNA(Gln) amidotransferase subunit B